MNTSSPIRSFPPHSILTVLFAVAFAYLAYAVIADVEFPVLYEPVSSGFEIGLWLISFATMAAATIRFAATDVENRKRQWWIALITIASISVLQLNDSIVDLWDGFFLTPSLKIDYIFDFLLAIMITFLFFASSKLPRNYAWAAVCLKATIVFQLIAIFSRLIEPGHTLGGLGFAQQSAGLSDFIADMSDFICIEYFVIGLVLIRTYATERNSPALSGRVGVTAAGRGVGRNARKVFHDCNLYYGAKHPPVALAYYPLLQEVVLFIIIGWLSLTTGRIIKRATGKPVRHQIKEMTSLWFSDGIDPPSYYAQDLYKPQRLSTVEDYLTRYETKNGLLHALNNRLPNPFPISELRNKVLFAQCCEGSGVPFPQTLATLKGGKIEIHSNDAAVFDIDLFCKRQSGMGAIGTHSFTYKACGHYRGSDGQEYDLEGLLQRLKQESMAHPMLVQPWLKNHPSIAHLALDSLITMRVVTCKNERDEPEVTLAMLRLLSKLEPQWKHLPDEEYAAPINLLTGELGLFTGDNLRTSHLRYEKHPVTGREIKGRLLQDWPAIRDVALSAHRAFANRLLVGWDIALTDRGIFVLEGNTNLDVMFLQRVHDAPIGWSRLGGLLNFHLQGLYAERHVSS
jgi:Sugar-transfer associated ATP-grasp